MDDNAEDLEFAASEGHPDPIADGIEHIAARIHTELANLQLLGKRSRTLAKKRHDTQRRAIVDATIRRHQKRDASQRELRSA